MRFKYFVQDHARLLVIIVGIIVIAAIAVITTLLLTNRGVTTPNPSATPKQIITDPAKITTVTPIPTTTPGGTPTIITAPPTTPKTTVTQKPQTTTSLTPLTNQYTTAQLAQANTTATLGYTATWTYTSGETAKTHKTRLIAYYEPTSSKIDVFDKNIKTAKATALNTAANGLYKNGHLNVQIIEHVTGVTTSGAKIDTSYQAQIELAYTKATNSWRIVNYTQIEEKK